VHDSANEHDSASEQSAGAHEAATKVPTPQPPQAKGAVGRPQLRRPAQVNSEVACQGSTRSGAKAYRSEQSKQNDGCGGRTLPGGRKQQPMSTSRKVRATLLAHATAAYSANRSTPGSVHTALCRATPGRRGTKAAPQVFGATNLLMRWSAHAPEPDQHRQLHHCVLQRAAPARARADDILLAAGALCLRAPRCCCIGRRSAIAGHPARCVADKSVIVHARHRKPRSPSQPGRRTRVLLQPARKN